MSEARDQFLLNKAFLALPATRANRELIEAIAAAIGKDAKERYQRYRCDEYVNGRCVGIFCAHGRPHVHNRGCDTPAPPGYCPRSKCVPVEDAQGKEK